MHESRQLIGEEESKSSALSPQRYFELSTVLQYLLALLGVLLGFFAYKGIVTKAFLGDDHVHLIWLQRAVMDPSLVLHNFYSNWLYAGTTPQCYRPMISVFMYLDYLLWHHNGIGFHITNLLFHLICCIALFGCVSEVRRWSSTRTELRLWPVISAGIFALYPSHPEAVSWITGRVDSIVTAFYLASIYCYMISRRTERKSFFVFAIIFALASFASKEMAVTIPVTCFFFEFFKSDSQKNELVGLAATPSSKFFAYTEKLKKSFSRSWPMWLMLVLYFVLRKFALGTFIGGYDDSLSINVSLLFEQWKAGLTKFFIPINAYYEVGNANLVTVWEAFSVAGYLASFSLLFRSKHRNQLLFFVAFALISFAPVYKLFNGIPDLQGSRFSYLASAPIAAIFAIGIGQLPAILQMRSARSRLILQALLSAAFFICSGRMLWVNNQPWVAASSWELRLSRDMNLILANAKTDDSFAFFNIPNNYRGAYLARNAIGDIGQHQNVDWEAVEADDRHNELGQLRQKISARKPKVRSYFWFEGTGALEPVSFPPGSDEEATEQQKIWNALPIWRRCTIVQGRERVTADGHAGSALNSISIKAGSAPAMVLVSLQGLSTWNCEFLRLREELPADNFAGPGSESVSLILSNKYMSANFVHPTAVSPEAGSHNNMKTQHDLMFSTRSIPSWFCTNQAATAVLLFPPSWSGKFSLSVIPEKTILPSLKRAGAGHDITAIRSEKILFDVSNIPEAKGALVQISKKNECFRYQSTSDFEATSTDKTILFKSCAASSVLRYEDFAGDGQYQVRCWAVDETGKVLGVSSDYLFFIVQRNGP